MHEEVSEFGIGYKLAVNKQRRAYSCSHRNKEYRSADIFAVSETVFGYSGGIGIIYNTNLVARYFRKKLVGVYLNIRFVDVGCGPYNAVFYNSRITYPYLPS